MQKIELTDRTLRESSKNEEGFSFREKLEIAKLLDNINVSVIELPSLSGDKADCLLAKSIASSTKNSRIALSAELSEDGVEKAWEAIKGAKKARLQITVPMSAAQMEYVCHKKPPMILNMIGELCEKCRSYCDEVEFIADDATRSEKSFLINAIEKAVENGAGIVTLCDTAGIMTPDEMKSFVSEIINMPCMKNVKLGVLCADGLCMAVSNSVTAIRMGASEIKTCVCRGGITDMDSIAQVIRTRGDDFGIMCDISYAQLQRTLKQMKVMTSDRSKTSPFENGVNQQDNDTLSIEFNVNDSITAVSNAVKSLGYDLSEDDMSKVYDAFKHIAAKKNVNIRELEAIVASAALQVPPTYILESYVINTGNIISSTAHIKLKKDDKLCQGICVGDGPIDASFLAIEQIVGHHYELDDFQIQSVTEGREAMGSAFIKLRSNGKIYSGKGISTDILGASIRAYINALNKIVYEEN